MKRYLNNIVMVAIIILLFSDQMKAQSDSSYLKFSVKTNALQWIMNEPNIAFEYRSSLKTGIETTIGGYGIYQLSDYAIGSFPPFMPYKGFTMRVNPKFYFLPKKKPKKDAFYYLSPMFLLKNVWIKDKSGGDLSIVYYNKNRTVVGLSLLAGYQGIKGKHFLLDGYMGLGARVIDNVPDSYSESGLYPSIHLGIKLDYSFKPIN